MSVESTHKVMKNYLKEGHSEASVLADDVVFTLMGTGEQHHGPEAVQGMLDYLYRVAFKARAETKNLIISDQHAVLEADFIGRHIGEFANVPPTGKDVNVPLCVVYDIEEEHIKRGRVYFEMPVLLQQLGIQMGSN